MAKISVTAYLRMRLISEYIWYFIHHFVGSGCKFP